VTRLERWRQDDPAGELQRILSSADIDHPSPDQLARLSSKLESAIGLEWSNGEASRPDILQPSAATTGGALNGAAGSSLGPIVAVTTALMLGLGAAFLTLRPDEPLQPSASEGPVVPASLAVPEAPIASPIVPLAPPTSLPLVAEPPAPAVAAESAAPVRAAVRAEARASGGGLGEELRQLEAIRRTLVRDPAKALVATARHARRFPQGAFGPERELLKIEALLRMDRKREAWQLASSALANPHPYRAQILQLMAADTEN
jgi:hypothetical protein